MLKCKEVARLLASDELEGARLHRRLSVRAHLLMCRHCRRYAAQLRALGSAARDLWGTKEPDTEAIARLRGSILRDRPGRSDP